MTESLNFIDLRETNVSRARRWHPGFPDANGPNDWTGADWGNAMQGESGEAGNIVKKLRRLDTNHASVRDGTREILIEGLAEEIADTIIYADLLAAYYGIDVASAVIDKFNKVSDREGFPEQLVVNTNHSIVINGTQFGIKHPRHCVANGPEGLFECDFHKAALDHQAEGDFDHVEPGRYVMVDGKDGEIQYERETP